MELPLVVGVDGSDSSLLAVDWAVDEAARHGLPLRLVHASLWERYERAQPSFSTDRPAEAVMAQHIIASCVERARLRDPEVKASGEVVPEDAASALLQAAPEAFVLVTGVRGRGRVAGLLLGSVSLAVAARAACPVVVVRGAAPNRQGDLGRVVVGVGDPVRSAGAVRFAVREAETRGSAVTAVRAWRIPAQEPVNHMLIADDAARLREERAAAGLDDALSEVARDHPQVDIRRRPVEGPAHEVLLKASAEADLVVVGAPRRHGHAGLQLGRVAHALLHHSACPVAVVPEPV
ncbi:universal stress protein [Streptomyces sp. Li-HN-5-11]|uniref:universal stress protein n=1 Tax=Streptomyces sp. Li-HN-5-11 TaxID=3075432 RepID=UPI0028AA94BE|nr:universal stress protein [Streptomyces sp. Li-HN-5-11]WNM36547.1 universal stress protein [Streptomyces sp. Li-HN-5-11]